MQANDILHLSGVCSLAVLEGAVEICGAQITLQKGPVCLYSPRCNAYLSIEAVCSSIIKLESCPDDPFIKALPALSAFESNTNLLNNLFGDQEQKSTFKLLTCEHRAQDTIRNSGYFYTYPSWRQILHSLLDLNSAQPLIVMVVGERKLGKSTFARYLTNGLLNKHASVIFVELDIGQTEFTPTGVVSAAKITRPLLGPPFTHMRIPEIAKYVGQSSPSEDLSSYLQAVSAVLSESKRRFPNQPFVINTMGWLEGLGASLLSLTARFARPTHCLYMESCDEGYIHNLLHSDPKLMIESNPIDYSILTASVERVSKPNNAFNIAGWSPGDQRALMQLFYHHSIEAFTQIDPQPLTHFTPFIVPGRSIHFVDMINISIKDSISKDILNCSIVGLLDKNQWCLGLGLIRYADDDKLHILTPILCGQNEVNIRYIAVPRSNNCVPLRFFTEHTPFIPDTPYLSCEAAFDEADMAKPRKNLLRKRLLSNRP